ncbi:MAG: hypothetical protein ABI999_03525 [Acidobacteriota bacterium]
MITGYNTDIEFDGTVYHVQTEDKGVTSPVIMSLVYNRGTILASKRVPYDDLLTGDLDERALSERLQRQHKLICAAVSAGRIEDLKEMSARNLKSAAAKRSEKKNVTAEDLQTHSSVEAVPLPVRDVADVEEIVVEPPTVEAKPEVPQVDVPPAIETPVAVQTAAVEAVTVPEPLEFRDEFPVVPVQQEDPEIQVSADLSRVETPVELPAPSKTTPEPRFVSLSPEPVAETPNVDLEAETKVYSNLLVSLEIDEEEEMAPIAKPVFEPLPSPPKQSSEHITLGDRAELKSEQVVSVPVGFETTVFRTDDIDFPSEEPMIIVDAVEAVSDLAGAERPETNRLSVDIIGETKFRGGERKDVYVMVCRGSNRKVVPRAEVMVKVLGSSFRPVICHAVTDGNGLATINLKIPQFQSGRATVIARAISEGEEVEIRQAVAHG